MPILSSPRDGHHSDECCYIPGRLDAGPLLEDWAEYLAHLDSVGGLFPNDPRPDEAPEADDAFEPSLSDVEWNDAQTREGGA